MTRSRRAGRAAAVEPTRPASAATSQRSRRPTGARDVDPTRARVIGALAVLTAGAAAIAAGRVEPALFGDVLRLLLVVGLASALVGNWLIVRRMAMMSDAIGHSILLGIVVMFFFVQDPGSPLFVIGAALAGVLTVFLTETLMRTGLVREDASIGLVFSFLFALALLIVGVFFRDAHVDQHLVLAGGVEFTVLDRLVLHDLHVPLWIARTVGGLVQAIAPVEAVRVTPDLVMTVVDWDLGPRGLWTAGFILAVNLVAVAGLWKELKLTTFDPALAATLGFRPGVLNYGLMALVAITAVGAFDAVGSILVVALFITPPATAFLLTEDLAEMVALSVIVAALDVLLGFGAGLAWNVNFGGAVAAASGGVFLVTLLVAPQQGVLAQAMRRHRQRAELALDTLLVHLAAHGEGPRAAEECSVATLPQHLGWTAERVTAVARAARRDGFVTAAEGVLALTATGVDRAALALDGAG